MKKITLIIFLIFINYCFSQQEQPLNNPVYDNQTYHFGFTLGISNTKFQINHSEEFINSENISEILSKYEPGFNVGIIIDFRLTKNTNLRLTPSFNFTDQKIYFTYNNNETIEPKNNTGVSNFELPLYLKYRSDRINNGRAYLLVGSNFILDMSSTKKLNQIQNLEFKNMNYSLDIGFGIDIYFSYFKFSPEIKYAYGLQNVLQNQENEYSQAINKLSTRALLISLTFE